MSGEPVQPSLAEAKAALRRRIRAAPAATTGSQRAEWSAEIAIRLSTMPEVAAAKTILFYSPMLDAGEVDILPLARQALAVGKAVCFPLIDWTNLGMTMECAPVTDLDRDLVVPSSAPGRPRQPGDWLSTSSIDQLDLILVPGLAFDPRGRRLGRGGGYYDRLLADPACKGLSVAPAFECQVVDEVPLGAHDRPVNRVVTPTRTLGPDASMP